MYTPRLPHERYDQQRGLIYRTEGQRTFIYWTPQMIDWLKRYFPTNINQEIAEELGVSPRTMLRKARELGLKKDQEWLYKIREERRLMAAAKSKRLGHPGCFKPGCRVGEKYWFKKGHK